MIYEEEAGVRIGVYGCHAYLRVAFTAERVVARQGAGGRRRVDAAGVRESRPMRRRTPSIIAGVHMARGTSRAIASCSERQACA